jgi:DNA repair exonuclease SbcCD ATPase subunit
MKEELQTGQQALENAREDAATASANLVTLQQLYDDHVAANMNAQEDLMQQVRELQQSLLLREADSHALSAQVAALQERLASQDTPGALQKEAEEEIERLHTDLEQAEEREDGLLLQVQTLEQTIEDLTAASDALQAAAPNAGEVCSLGLGAVAC